MPGECAVCKIPAQHTCGGCKLVNYCNKDHQKMHWKTSHKSDCSPLFRIERNEILGRYVVATRDIQVGELIFQEPPLVLGPKAFSLPICLGCHNLCDIKKYHECDGCGYPLCSVQCQVSDNHFEECRLMMEKKFRAKVNVEEFQKGSIYFPIVPLRCLLLKDKYSEKFKKALDLQSHIEEKKNTPLYSLYKKNIAEFLIQRLGLKEFDEETILKICCILDTNAFEVRTKTTRVRGLYSLASMIAHSCKPNTKHTFHGNDNIIAVSATTKITKGEIITATYTQTFWSTLPRREHLKIVKCFDCTCERCSDPTELGTYLGAIRCTRCVVPTNYLNGPYIMSTNPLDNNAPWKCEECGHEIAAKLIRSGNEHLKDELSRIDKKAPQGLENFLTKYGAEGPGVLHPRNTYVVQVKHALVQMYGNTPGYLLSEISDELLEKKIDYCHELLELVDILDPGYSRIRGQLLNELQMAMTIQTKRQFNEGKITKDAAQKALNDALAILSEVIKILQVEPDIEQLKEQLDTLSKELDT